jgi:hypothetical protein
MAPSRGLVFPDSTVAHPIEPVPYDRSVQIRNGELNWIGGQALRRGFLRSREMHQYMVVDASTNTARVDVRPGDPPTVVNELGGRIESLVVQLDDGQLYTANEVDVGEEAKLAPVKGELANLMRESMSESQFDPDVYAVTTASYRYRYFYWNNVDNNALPADMGTSVLEQFLNRARTGSLLEPHSYIAVVRDPKWLPMGVPDAEHTKCFDMVFGKW